MADPWTPPAGEEHAAAPIPRQVERYAVQSTLADLARTGAVESPPQPETKPGLTGHQALAALAAEVAEAAAAARPAEEDSETAEPPGRLLTGSAGVSPIVGTSLIPVDGGGEHPAGFPRARPRPFGPPVAERPPMADGPPVDGLPLDGAPVDRAPVDGPPAGRRGLALGSGGLPAAVEPSGADRRPLSRLRPDPTPSTSDPAPAALPTRLAPPSAGPSPVRLSPAAPSALAGDATGRARDEQPTIALRRRPIASGPAAVAPAPTQETTAPVAPPAAAGRSVAVVEAWLPSDDDILPRRPAGRRRAFRRGR